MLRRCGLGAWAAALVAAHAAAQPAPALKVGDPAPPLTVGTWLKGGPIAAFEPGKVYVVDMVATWAPKTGESIAVLSDFQRQFADRGVVVIGVFVRENQRVDPSRFVQERAEAIGYAVATDDVPLPPGGAPDDRLWAMDRGRTSAAWMKAIGRDILPTAFVVDGSGRLAWVGQATYPRGELEEAVTRVLAGTLTPEESAALSVSFKEREAKLDRCTARFRQALAQKNFKGAVEIMDEMIALAPARMLSDANFVGPKMVLMMAELKDEAGAYAFARETADGAARANPKVLHAMAWVILDTKGVARRDLDLALSLARRADELTEHKAPLVLDTLARALFERGELGPAVEAQSRAVEFQRAAAARTTPEGRRAADAYLATLEATLKRYEEDRARRGGG